MGNWYTFPKLIIDRRHKQSIDVQVDDGYWVNSYGKVTATVISEGLNLTFQIQGPGKEVYNVFYNASSEANTHVDATTDSPGNLTVKTEPGTYGIDGPLYDYIYVTQSKESTISGSNPLEWEFKVLLEGSYGDYSFVHVWVEPGTTTTSSSLSRNSVVRKLTTVREDSPTIEVSFIPDGNFKDIASVTFSLKNVQELGCASGNYKQLLSTPLGKNEGDVTQQIHVFAPLVTCHLAGEGDFSTEKMYSVNKAVGPVWPEVFLYAMAKFILNRLLNNHSRVNTVNEGVFDMDILYRRHTKKFLEQLGKSDYSDFVQFFDQEQDKERYFLR